MARFKSAVEISAVLFFGTLFFEQDFFETRVLRKPIHDRDLDLTLNQRPDVVNKLLGGEISALVNPFPGNELFSIGNLTKFSQNRLTLVGIAGHAFKSHHVAAGSVGGLPCSLAPAHVGFVPVGLRGENVQRAVAVVESDPDREYEETINKAKALFKAVEFAERGLEP